MDETLHPEEFFTWDGKYTISEWWDLMVEAQAERGQIELLRRFVNKGDLIFDIGASRGSMTLLFRQLGARVIAVDPLFSFFKEFEWKWGEDEMVVPVEAAVSNVDGMTKMRFREGVPWISSIDSAWITKSTHARFYNDNVCENIRVPTVSMDTLIDIHGVPKFAKIDVEGHENHVIAGLTKAIPGLSLEFHEDWIPWSALVRLSTMAEYRFNYSMNRTSTYVLDEWTDHETLVGYMREHLEKAGKASWGDIYADCR
jgi:FkbM family methyltransferase